MDVVTRVPGIGEALITFEEFYKENWDRVRRTLSVVLGDSDLANEATDEAMARTFERWDRVRRADNPSGWTYRVALNWAKRQIRRRAYGKRLLDDPAGQELGAPEPKLRSALEGLSVDHRMVVLLRYSEDWSEKQIAEALEIPVGTVKSRLHRALSHLREELE